MSIPRIIWLSLGFIFTMLFTVAAQADSYGQRSGRVIRLVAHASDTQYQGLETVKAVGIGEVMLADRDGSRIVLVPQELEEKADSVLAGGISEKLRRAGHIEYVLSPLVKTVDAAAVVPAPVVASAPSMPAVTPQKAPVEKKVPSHVLEKPFRTPIGAVLPLSYQKKKKATE